MVLQSRGRPSPMFALSKKALRRQVWRNDGHALGVFLVAEIGMLLRSAAWL